MTTERSSDALAPVVHVLPSYPPDTFGGIETYVGRIAGAQRDAGHDVRILCTAQSMPVGESEWEGVPVVRCAPEFPILQILDDLGSKSIGELAQPNMVVHVHHWHMLGNDLVRVARARGAAVVVSLHDLYSTCPLLFRLRDRQLCAPNQPLSECDACVRAKMPDEVAPRVPDGLRGWRAALRAELLAADAVLTMSRTQREFTEQIPQLDGVPLRVVDLPAPDVDLNRLFRVRFDPGNDQELRVVTWGGLTPGKGNEVLVAACAQLPFATHVHHFGAKLDAAHVEEVKALATGHCTLTLHGRFDEREVNALGPFDVAVFPSMFVETYGCVVDEALLAGFPVVVSDRGALSERIGGRGLTFRCGDPSDLAAQIHKLHDPAQRAAMRNAPHAIRVASAEHYAALGRVYAEALAASATR